MGKFKRKQYYAVYNGHEPGVYRSWEQCRDQVDGYKGNKYKGFSTRREAEYFARYGREMPEGRCEYCGRW